MREPLGAADRASEDRAAAQISRREVALRGLKGPVTALMVSWLIALAALTLMPAAPTSDIGRPISRFCLVCGDRGTADAILNLLFFMPLGMGLAHLRRATAVSFAVGVCLSLTIEFAQLVVPGRYPTFGDVVWNGLGAAAGVLAIRGVAGQLATPARMTGRAGAVFVGGSVALAGWLLGHAPTDADYFGQWSADLGYMPQYEGTLVAASLDGLPLPSTRFTPDVRASERLAGDWTLAALVVKGPAPRAVSPIVSVYDADESEILLLGAHGEDLVIRERTRAKAIRLDHPDLRLERSLARIGVGDTVVIGARARGQERCLKVGEAETCGLGVTPGRTWSLLLYLEGVPERVRRAVDTLWMLTLLIPIGVTSASPRSLLANGVVVSAFVAVGVGFTRLVVPPWWEIAGALAGLAAGCLAVRRVRGALLGN